MEGEKNGKKEHEKRGMKRRRRKRKEMKLVLERGG